MQDYVTQKPKSTQCAYSISKYLSYDNVTQKYRDYMHAFSVMKEPHSFKEAVKDKRWTEVMQ